LEPKKDYAVGYGLGAVLVWAVLKLSGLRCGILKYFGHIL
jgi:hypothetical protein